MDAATHVREEAEIILDGLKDIHERLKDLTEQALDLFPDRPASEKEGPVTLGINARAALTNGEGFLLKALQLVEKAVDQYRAIEQGRVESHI